MAALKKMPRVEVDQDVLGHWGEIWLGTVPTPRKVKAPKKLKKEKAGADPGEAEPVQVAYEEPRTKKPNFFDAAQQGRFPVVFDQAFAKALAVMLGNIPVVKPPSKKGTLLVPPQPDCVEVGATRIVGAIRPQNYDVAYRPDGPRVVFDSKTLNERESIRKNWQNMVNDLTAEASTVHIRFPMCVVVFIIAVPKPALEPAQERDIIRTLTRLGSRDDELDQHNLAEAAAFVVWDPETGMIDPNVPDPEKTPNLRIETLNERVEVAYRDRYANLPPHQEAETAEEEEVIAAVEEGVQVDNSVT